MVLPSFRVILYDGCVARGDLAASLGMLGVLACADILGADFDDLRGLPDGSAGAAAGAQGGAGSGGTAGTHGGTAAGSGPDAAGVAGAAGFSGVAGAGGAGGAAGGGGLGAAGSAGWATGGEAGSGGKPGLGGAGTGASGVGGESGGATDAGDASDTGPTCDGNQAPIAGTTSITVAEGESYAGQLPTSDPDGPTLGHVIVSQGAHGTATIDDSAIGTFTYAATLGAAGVDAFTYEVDDGCAKAQGQINVKAVALGPGSLVSPNSAAGLSFGRSLALKADVLAIGEPWYGAQVGRAYVARRDGNGVWAVVEQIASSSAQQKYFGWGVALDGEWLAAGAFGNTTFNLTGQVDVHRSTGGAPYQFSQSLQAAPPVANDFFGASVSLEGDTLAVGASGNSVRGLEAGAAHVFRLTGTSWLLEQDLLASDGAAYDKFGLSVAVSGDTLAVGAPLANAAGTDSGAVYLFERSGTTWSEKSKLKAGSSAGGYNLGEEVRASGGRVVATAFGAPSGGAAYAFSGSGTTWNTQVVSAPGGEAAVFFGWRIALRDDVLIVGNRGTGDNGAAYVYGRSGTTWAYDGQKITAPNANGTLFTWRLAYDDHTLAVAELGASSTAGAVHVYAVK